MDGAQGPQGQQGPQGVQGIQGVGLPGLVNGLNFWRALALALLTFILGNGVSFVVFGLHAASKMDLEKSTEAAEERSSRIEDRLESVERAVNYMGGELESHGIDGIHKGR